MGSPDSLRMFIVPVQLMFILMKIMVINMKESMGEYVEGLGEKKRGGSYLNIM